MVHITFGDHKLISGDDISKSNAQERAFVHWDSYPNEFYSLVIYDNDAPEPYKVNSPYCHLLVVNIEGNNVKTGKVLLDYVPPNPSNYSEPHNYYVEIYKGYKSPEKYNRINFNLEKFNNELELVDHMTFTVYPDDYESYSTLNKYNGDEKKLEYFKNKRNLSEREQKFCKCVLHVSAKQPNSCNYDKAWYNKRNGKTCYNPYAVCAKSTGTTSRKCSENYNFENIPDNELKAYGGLKHIPIPKKYNRIEMLKNIKTWKQQYEKNRKKMGTD